MNKLFLDFSINENYRPEEGKRLKKNIVSLMESFNKDESFFYSEILPNINKVFVSSPNFESREVNEKGRISNFFIRIFIPLSLSKEINNTGLTLRVNALIKENYVSFDVKEVLTCENNRTNHKSEFKKDGINIVFKNENNPRFSDRPTLANSCIDLNDLAEVPYIVEPNIMDEFINEWRDYLNFELEVIQSKIDYFKITKKVEYVKVTKIKYNEQRDLDINKESIIVQRKSNNEAYLLDGFHNNNYIIVEEFPLIKVEFINEKEGMDTLDKLLKLDLEISCEKDLVENDEFLLKDKSIKVRYKSIRTVDKFHIKKNENLITAYLYPDSQNTIFDGVYDISHLNENLIKIIKEDPIIMYTASGDSALYNRGTRALNDLYRGNVKNPWIAGYILKPEEFGENKNIIKKEEFMKMNKMKLNDKQSDAVMKALNTNDIFLLQGPPGTGKTQTITEMTYHLNKMGKKILLSSQTHVAIDNVLERLPYELDILPLRLLSRQKRENNFTIDKLVGNFYNNIVNKYQNKLDEFYKYQKEIQYLQSDIDDLRSKYNKFQSNKKEIENIKFELRNADKNNHRVNERISAIQVEIAGLEENLKEFNRLEKNKLHYNKEILDLDILLEKKKEDFIDELLEIININEKELLKIFEYLENTISKERREKIKKELSKHDELINKEIEKINTKLTLEHNNIKSKQKDIKLLKEHNVDTSDLEKELENFIVNIKEYENKKKSLQKKVSKFKNSSLKLILVNDILSIDSLKKELKLIDELDNDYKTICNKYIDIANKNKNKLELSISEKNKNIDLIISDNKKVVKEIEYLNKKISSIDSSSVKKISEINNAFRKHFNELDILDIPEDDESKINLIIKEVQEKVKDFKRFSSNFKKYESTYELVKNHIDNTNDVDLAIQDQLRYTEPLLNRFANVYGITCTSPDFFQAKYNKVLEDLNIGDISLKDQNFDVVIIDEVSKATPIELLIPILYGKSIILVGDHRQLPPTFKYHKSDLENLDGGIEGNIDRLNKFKKQVENSLFKQIFTRIKDENKSMLDQQYRMHSQIMKITNCFYNGKLKLGFEGQDNAKCHEIDSYAIKDNKTRYTLFDKDINALWLNSNFDEKGNVCLEERINTSTSLWNNNEVKLTLNILKHLEKAYEIEYKKGKIDIKPSVGIISTYRLQSNKIKDALKRKKFKYIIIKLRDITTVDEYQGKEKDIIICNMVRNDGKKNSLSGNFVKQYERINVAFSRARKMLCIIGSIEYFRKLKVDIPNNDDNKVETINVYNNIIDTINDNGRVFNNPSKMFEGVNV